MSAGVELFRSGVKQLTMREYSKSETAIANIPYVAMILIGAVTIAYAYGFSVQALVGVAGYFAYGIVGAFWIMIFICPYCAYYATRGCPCGYGVISARISKKGDRDCFAAKFRRHIPVIVPLWMIPVACGGMTLWYSFSWPLVGLVSAFVVESCIILPVVSRGHGCVDCPQKDDCPWMARGARGTQQEAKDDGLSGPS